MQMNPKDMNLEQLISEIGNVIKLEFFDSAKELLTELELRHGEKPEKVAQHANLKFDGAFTMLGITESKIKSYENEKAMGDVCDRKERSLEEIRTRIQAVTDRSEFVNKAREYNYELIAALNSENLQNFSDLVWGLEAFNVDKKEEEARQIGLNVMQKIGITHGSQRDSESQESMTLDAIIAALRMEFHMRAEGREERKILDEAVACLREIKIGIDDTKLLIETALNTLDAQGRTLLDLAIEKDGPVEGESKILEGKLGGELIALECLGAKRGEDVIEEAKAAVQKMTREREMMKQAYTDMGAARGKPQASVGKPKTVDRSDSGFRTPGAIL
ncbi:Uncharacterised protein [Candidatus Gugararchaeum adminiculabundum]|nr:Uncharacterised protein [Candidatus Gugararchaeum adminiculabundum]